MSDERNALLIILYESKFKFRSLKDLWIEVYGWFTFLLKKSNRQKIRGCDNIFSGIYSLDYTKFAFFEFSAAFFLLLFFEFFAYIFPFTCTVMALGIHYRKLRTYASVMEFGFTSMWVFLNTIFGHFYFFIGGMGRWIAADEPGASPQVGGHWTRRFGHLEPAQTDGLLASVQRLFYSWRRNFLFYHLFLFVRSFFIFRFPKMDSLLFPLFMLPDALTREYFRHHIIIFYDVVIFYFRQRFF